MSTLDKTNKETSTRLALNQRQGSRKTSLRLRASERKFILAIVDTLLIFLALIMAVLLRTNLITSVPALFLNIKWFVTLAIVWAIMAVAFDAYNLARAAAPAYGYWAIAAAVALTGVVYLAIPWLTPPLENRSYGFIFVSLAVVMVVGWRLIYALLFAQPAFQLRSLVIGAGTSGLDLVDVLAGKNEVEQADPFLGTGHRLVGYIDDDPDLRGSDVAGVPILGDSSQLVPLVNALEIDQLILAITHTETICPQLFEAILDCREMGVPIVTMPTIYERLTGRVAIEHAKQNIEQVAGQTDSPFYRMYLVLKRVIDIIGAFVGILCLLLLIPLVALANALISPGPFFFRQRLVGQGGKVFRVIKFRSMVPDAERHSGAVWTREDDDRVTYFGRWLRLTHLDELPQVLNVIKGEMSLIGPRPERPEFVDSLSMSIPFYRVRHSLRPGISGWAQIHQDYGDSVELAQEKLEYDLYYLKRAGPWIDTIIMLRTVSKVLAFQGR